MALTIFYSWQSDVASNINRNFIEDALKTAIKRIRSELTLENAARDEDLELDKDTKDVPGIPPIADVILDKISRCAIFVPDLTFVGKSITDRPISNPNVLIEYGWALKEVSHSRIIPVMNTAFGEPGPSTLPFDMRHLRHPLQYTLSEKATSEKRSSEKAKLVKEFVSAIRLILESGTLDELASDTTSLVEVPHTSNPSTFLTEGERFASIRDLEDVQHEVYLPSVARFFLRIIPTHPQARIESSKTALDTARVGRLAPMSTEGAGATYGRNKYGAFACHWREDKAMELTQLLKNRELWGIETVCLSKKHREEAGGAAFSCFPSVWLEKIFIATLGNYLRFAKETLELSLPLRFIAGATDVKGYRMAAPHGMDFGSFQQLAGDVVDEHITYEGKITDYSGKVTDILRPFFDHVWEECGLERPNQELLG